MATRRTDLTDEEERELISQYMRKLQRKSAEARWSKLTPKQRSAEGRKLRAMGWRVRVIFQDRAKMAIRKVAQNRGHMLMVGRPGTGKSLTAKATAVYVLPVPAGPIANTISFFSQQETSRCCPAHTFEPRR